MSKELRCDDGRGKKEHYCKENGNASFCGKVCFAVVALEMHCTRVFQKPTSGPYKKSVDVFNEMKTRRGGFFEVAGTRN